MTEHISTFQGISGLSLALRLAEKVPAGVAPRWGIPTAAAATQESAGAFYGGPQW